MTSRPSRPSRERLVERVEADLARGHTHLAVNRLGTWLAQHPGDLDARRRLGAVHHATGNWPEAGRWGFFEDDVDPRDLAAFERAFPAAESRRRALRWDGSAGLSRTAQVRLTEMRDLPTRAGTRADLTPRPGLGGSVREVAGVVGCLVGVLALGVVFVVGAVSVVRWLFS